MKKRLLGVLAFAVAVSAGAAFVLYQLISSRVKVGAATKPATTTVLVAAHDLSLGALIQEKDVIAQEYLTPPAGAITKKEDIVGRGVVNPIHQDGAFFDGALAPKGAGAGFAATIPQGMRAFAIHVNEVVGVAGFAIAGMRVDVLVAGAPPGSNGSMLGSITRTLLQNIQVLSAGQNFQKDAEGKPVLVQVVNLLVTPQQAEILNLATQQTIQLVLRNPSDKEIVSTPGAATANLFSGEPIRAPRFDGGQAGGGRSDFGAQQDFESTPRVRPPAPRREASQRPLEIKPDTVTIEVFQGNKRMESTFKDPDAAPDKPQDKF